MPETHHFTFRLYEFDFKKFTKRNHKIFVLLRWLLSLGSMSSWFIHVVACVNIFILRLNNIPLHIYILLIHSSVNGTLGCFHISVLVNNAMNLGI